MFYNSDEKSVIKYSTSSVKKAVLFIPYVVFSAIHKVLKILNKIAIPLGFVLMLLFELSMICPADTFAETMKLIFSYGFKMYFSEKVFKRLGLTFLFAVAFKVFVMFVTFIFDSVFFNPVHSVYFETDCNVKTIRENRRALKDSKSTPKMTNTEIMAQFKRSSNYIPR